MKFNDIRLKRREAVIKSLRERIHELEQMNLDAAVLQDKQIEADALIYQLNELLGKVSNELHELEEARHNYETERLNFIKLSAEYKKKMKKFFKDFNIKEDTGGDS